MYYHHRKGSRRLKYDYSAVRASIEQIMEVNKIFPPFFHTRRVRTQVDVLKVSYIASKQWQEVNAFAAYLRLITVRQYSNFWYILLESSFE